METPLEFDRLQGCLYFEYSPMKDVRISSLSSAQKAALAALLTRAISNASSHLVNLQERLRRTSVRSSQSELSLSSVSNVVQDQVSGVDLEAPENEMLKTIVTSEEELNSEALLKYSGNSPLPTQGGAHPQDAQSISRHDNWKVRRDRSATSLVTNQIETLQEQIRVWRDWLSALS